VDLCLAVLSSHWQASRSDAFESTSSEFNKPWLAVYLVADHLARFCDLLLVIYFWRLRGRTLQQEQPPKLRGTWSKIITSRNRKRIRDLRGHPRWQFAKVHTRRQCSGQGIDLLKLCQDVMLLAITCLTLYEKSYSKGSP
jgi:hypothetical protein